MASGCHFAHKFGRGLELSNLKAGNQTKDIIDKSK